jgi:uncharacterized membrane protein YqiK
MATTHHEDDKPERSYGDAPTPSSGAGMGIAAIVFALMFIVGPLAALSIGVAIPTLATIILVGFGVLLLLIGMIVVVITKLYVKTGADEAIVRTGMGGQKTIINGGIMFIPVVHKIIKVSLRTMRIDVARTGKDALITGDNLRADVVAEFFMRVAKDKDAVVSAATSLGERSTHPDNIRTLLEQKLVNALRTVAATQNLEDLNRNRSSFVEEIQKNVTTDLAHNGLTLESVTISSLDQTETKDLRDNNIFDAKGLRTIAEITNKQLVEKNQIEADAKKRIASQNLERDRFLLDQAQSLATAKAAQETEIAKAQAQRKQEAESYTADQTRQAETAKVVSAQAIRKAEIEREQALAVAAAAKVRAETVAQVEAQQAQQIAAVKKEREVQLAEREKGVAVAAAEQKRLVADVEAKQAQLVAQVNSEQAQQVADRRKQIAVAQAEKERAVAEALKLAAEAEAETNRQAVATVETVKTAEREKEKKVIEQQAAAAQKQIEMQVKADAEAYARIKTAEGQKSAAAAEAQAITTKANAERDAAKAHAEGARAEQMVAVDVANAEVTVAAARVEVKRTDMRIQTENADAAISKELLLAQIAAARDIEIAKANAMGQALAKANIQVWGDPSAVSKMTEGFFAGQGFAQNIGGFMNALPDGLKSKLADLGQVVMDRVASDNSHGAAAEPAAEPEAE